MQEGGELFNNTISSWIDDEGLNKKIDVSKLKEKSKINDGAFGVKFCLQNADSKKFFNKEVDIDLTKAYDYYAHIALYSAFVSCFSHTPYPICKNKFQYEHKDNYYNKDFILYRFDDTLDKDSFEDITAEMKSFFNDKSNCCIDCVDFDTTVFSNLSKRAKKNIIQLYIHIIFFNMKDRKLQNLLFCNDGMHHLDLDFGNFMFDIMLRRLGKYNKKYVEDLSNAFLTDGKNVKKYIELEINKIKNINFETFIERYIGRCLALDVEEDRAFKYLNDNFIKGITEYYIGEDGINNNNETIFSTISEEINGLIKKGIKEVWNSFSTQMNKLKYMTDKELFLQKFDEIKETLKEKRKQKDVKVNKEDEKCIKIESNIQSKPISIKEEDESDNTDEKKQQILINENQYNNNNISNKEVETSNGDTIINENSVYSISKDKIGTKKAIMITGEESTNGCGCCGINLNDINPFRWFKQK